MAQVTALLTSIVSLPHAMRAAAAGMCVAATLLTPRPANAETHTQVYNGATCVAYPPNDNTVAVPYTYFLYGFKESASCHIMMPDGWTVNELYYVQFAGRAPAGPESVRVRLCVYEAGSAPVCGHEGALTPGTRVGWVLPPATIPAYATGAYLEVRFPRGQVTVFDQFIPVWYR